MIAPNSREWPAPANVSTVELADIQAEFARGWQQLLSDFETGSLAVPADRRFSSAAWSANPADLLMAHAYLLAGRAMQRMVDATQADHGVRERLRFAVMQWVEAVAPSNYFATNPDARQKILQTHGQSLRDGLANLIGDMQKGRLSQTDESRFLVGENVATTEGQVVFQNTLMQVIQYAPLTATVYQRPLLVVPPCINKFYILDLQPDNSFVRYAVQQGFTVFMVSWRNPLPTDDDGIQQACWDDYLQQGVLTAIDVVRDISRLKQINTLGFCVGGTMLASALALAKAQGDEPVASLTLLTTLLDFHDTGILDVFVDENHAATREKQLGDGGLMSARELATTFSFLRPNELVWNYVVSNYLKGDAPPAFDLLFWNSDGTNLPGPFFTWYFRNTYLENKLKNAGEVQIDGQPIDLGSLTMPAYIYGSHDDHIVPWQAAYATTRLINGFRKFVLGASGHIAGVINPPSKNRRHYWTQSDGDAVDFATTAQNWLDSAEQRPGSWWPDWSDWLQSYAGSRKKASAKLGNARHKPLEPAPGSYVKVRAV